MGSPPTRRRGGPGLVVDANLAGMTRGFGLVVGGPCAGGGGHIGALPIAVKRAGGGKGGGKGTPRLKAATEATEGFGSGRRAGGRGWASRERERESPGRERTCMHA